MTHSIHCFGVRSLELLSRVKDVGKVLRNQQLHLFHSHIRFFISFLSSMVYRSKRQPVWLAEDIDTRCRVSVD